MTYLLASVVLALTGVVAVLSVAVYRFGSAAIDRGDRAADARAIAAQREGEATLDAEKVTEANAATQTVAAAEKQQEKRGDALEKELADDQARPSSSGLDRLHALGAGAGEAAADSSPAAGGSRPVQ